MNSGVKVAFLKTPFHLATFKLVDPTRPLIQHSVACYLQSGDEFMLTLEYYARGGVSRVGFDARIDRDTEMITMRIYATDVFGEDQQSLACIFLDQDGNFVDMDAKPI